MFVDDGGGKKSHRTILAFSACPSALPLQGRWCTSSSQLHTLWMQPELTHKSEETISAEGSVKTRRQMAFSDPMNML